MTLKVESQTDEELDLAERLRLKMGVSLPSGPTGSSGMRSTRTELQRGAAVEIIFSSLIARRACELERPLRPERRHRAVRIPSTLSWRCLSHSTSM